ncbi:MAG: hypothetical protein K2M90_00170, partial [Treponemataceae bacterium]|nr:hypothetical protein [Treponemataceae bacterium]
MRKTRRGKEQIFVRCSLSPWRNTTYPSFRQNHAISIKTRRVFLATSHFLPKRALWAAVRAGRGET